MRILYVGCPHTLLESPFSWNHDLVLEVSVAEEQGHTLGFIDNAMSRFDLEVLVSHAQKSEVKKIVLYGGLKEYRFIKQYLPRLSKVAETVVRGFPRGIIDGLPIEDSTVPPSLPDELPRPNWGFLPLQDYWRNSPLPWTGELATLQRRSCYWSIWDDEARSPEKVVADLAYLRLLWFYDFMVFRDDLTQDLKRTQAFLDELNRQDLEGLFYWSCRADPERVSVPILNSLKRAGCRGIDYGEFDATETRDVRRMVRLETAVVAAKTRGIYPSLECVVGHPETTQDDLVEALKFLKSLDLPTRPKLAEPYPGTTLHKFSEERDVEKLVLNINEGFVNLTSWSDEELLGIVELMARGDLERLEKIKR